MSDRTTIVIQDYLIHGIYFLLYGLVKYVPSPLGDILRYFVSKPFMSKLGRVRIYEGVTLWYPYRIKIGNNTTLNEWVYLSGYGGVQIGSGVRIGHRTSVISSDHVFQLKDVPIAAQGLLSKPVVIEDDVYIGCNVTILGGVTVGKGAVIGAGSVVTSDVAPWSVVAGVPAKTLGHRK